MVRPVPRDDDGASAAEYAILVAAVAALIVAVVFLLGQQVFGLFDSTCRAVSSGTGTSADC